MIAPSLLAADFNNLEKEINLINGSEADWLHIDVMDGVFVPNISFGFPVLDSIRQICKKPLDVHLMIIHPEKYIQRFKDSGAYLLNVHIEACHNLHRTLNEIRETGMKAGVTLNPHTPIELLEDIINDTDLVLIMSVNPGYGGQTFIENTYQKVSRLKSLIDKKHSKALIQVDGGVTIKNAQKLYNCGADVLVAGTTVFHAEKPLQVISQIKSYKKK